MNTVNNKRKKASQIKIQNTFIELLQSKDIEEISVTDICHIANLNRSTFYANYIDIYDLVEKMEEKMVSDFEELYDEEIEKKFNSNDFLKLFYHIKENQIFYKTYFKLNFEMNFKATKYDVNLAKKYYNNQYIEYHMEFFKGGITSIIKMWLESQCKISPEELAEIIRAEYANKF